MPTFNWLHITDLHFGAAGARWKWSDIKENFFDDLADVVKRSGPIDLILLTGDLVFSGKADEFETADKFLAELTSFLQEQGSTPLLAAIPGNHDLRRPDKPLPAALTSLGFWEQNQAARQDFWSRPDSEYRVGIAHLFEAYEAWWKKTASSLPSYRPGPLPGDFSFTFEKDGARLGIVGLNATFLQFLEGDYRGKLALDVQQFHGAHEDADGARWLRTHHASVLLTHQPRSWLNAAAQRELDEINKPGRFAVHLFGHMHEFETENRSIGGTDYKRTWQGDSLFGLEMYMREGKVEEQRSHGYSIGQIRIETADQGTICFWPRKAELKAGAYSFGPDNRHFKLDEDNWNSTRRESFNLTKTFPGLPAAAAVRTTSLSRPLRTAAQVLGFTIPGDYQHRPAVEEPVRQWCSSPARLSRMQYVHGLSGAGKTTTLGWLFQEAHAGRLGVDLVPAWLPLTQLRHPLDAARMLLDALRRVTSDPQKLTEASDLIERAEQALRQQTPQLLAITTSTEIASRLQTTAPQETSGGAGLYQDDQRPRTITGGLPSSAEQPAKLSQVTVLPPARGVSPYMAMSPETPKQLMLYGARQQVTFHSLTDVRAMLDLLARQLAIALTRDAKPWVVFVDTWDWAQVGASAQVNPESSASWISDFFLRVLAMNTSVLVVVAGQIPVLEISTRFKKHGFETTSIDIDAFTDEEFRQFLATKGVSSEASVRALEEWTGRNPQLVRFWFELKGEGESSIQSTKGSTHTMRKASDWLWRQMMERMPEPLPRMYQLAAVLPAFDRTILETSLGVTFEEEAWMRFRDYSIVRPLSLTGLDLFHIKDVFAQLLMPTVKPDDVAMVSRGAIGRFLQQTNLRLAGLDAEEIARQRELSTILFQTAGVVADDDLLWTLFLRETARWMDNLDEAMGKTLLDIVQSSRLTPDRRRVIGTIRQAWADLTAQPARKTRRVRNALRVLLEADEVPTETMLALVRVAVSLSTSFREWNSVDEILALLEERGLSGDERLLQMQCRLELARGNRDAAIAIVDHASRETVSARTLVELGDFARDGLSDYRRAVRLYSESVESFVDSPGPCVSLVYLLSALDEGDHAVRIASPLAARMPEHVDAVVSLGLAYSLLHPPDWDRARPWFDKAARLQPHDGAIIANLATAIRETSTIFEARKRLCELARQLPESAMLAEVTGEMYAGFAPVDWQTAAEWFEKAVRLEPHDKLIVTNFVRSMVAARGVEAARNELTALANELPSSAWLADQIGECYGSLAPIDWERAAEWHEKAARLLPNEKTFAKRVAFAVKNVMDLASARRRIEALAKELNTAELADIAGSMYGGLEPRDWEKAVTWHERATRLQPNDPTICLNLAAAYSQNREVSKVRQHLASLANEFPESGHLAGATAFACTLEPPDLPAAADWYERSVRLQPRERDPIVALATVLEATGDVALRQRKLETLAEEFPDSGWLAEKTAESYGSLEPKDWTTAAQWHEKALRLLPRERRIAANLARSLIEAQGVSAAREGMQKLAEEYPLSAWLSHTLGDLFAKLEPLDYAKAANCYERAVRLEPGEPTFLQYLGSALLAIDPAQAREKIDQIASEYPGSAWAAYTAGAMWHNVDAARGIEWFTKALHLQPEEKTFVDSLALTLREAKGHRAAREELERLASQYKTNAWIANATALSYALSDPPEWANATAWYEKAIRLKQNDESIADGLAFTLHQAVGADEMDKRLEALARELPQSAAIGTRLAISKKDPAEVVAVLERIPRSTWFHKTHITAAWARYRLQEKDTARLHVEAVLAKITASSPAPHFREAAEAALILDRPQLVEEILEQAPPPEGKWIAIDALLRTAARAADESSPGLPETLEILRTQGESPGRWDCSELKTFADGMQDSVRKEALLHAIEFYEKKASAESLVPVIDRLRMPQQPV